MMALTSTLSKLLLWVVIKLMQSEEGPYQTPPKVNLFSYCKG